MTPVRLLLVEDDPDISRLLNLDLTEAGFLVTTETSVMRGLIAAREGKPDLIITDLGLPDGDGRDIVTRLRRDSEVPIIVLTARDEVTEVVELLALGADDYVVKPFQMEELLARIGVQLRTPAIEILTAGVLELVPSQRLVKVSGAYLPLSPKEFDLLNLFMVEPGRVLSREEISRALWNGEYDPESNVLDVHVANLRGKLRAKGIYGVLRTVRGFGYALTHGKPEGVPDKSGGALVS